MRDQYDAQMWNDHHDQFSRSIDGLFAAAGGAFRRQLAAPSGALPQLLAITGALSLTLLTFAASVA